MYFPKITNIFNIFRTYANPPLLRLLTSKLLVKTPNNGVLWRFISYFA